MLIAMTVERRSDAAEGPQVMLNPRTPVVLLFHDVLSVGRVGLLVARDGDHLELEVAAVDPDAPPPLGKLPAAVVSELLRVGHDHSPAVGLGSEADTMIGHDRQSLLSSQRVVGKWRQVGAAKSN